MYTIFEEIITQKVYGKALFWNKYRGMAFYGRGGTAEQNCAPATCDKSRIYD